MFLSLLQLQLWFPSFSYFGAARAEWMLGVGERRRRIKGRDEVVSGQNKFVLG